MNKRHRYQALDRRQAIIVKTLLSEFALSFHQEDVIAMAQAVGSERTAIRYVQMLEALSQHHLKNQ